MLKTTLSVVYAIEARVRIPTPSKAADAGDCWPNGPRSKGIAESSTRKDRRRVAGT